MARIKSGFIGERAIVLPLSVIEEFKVSELGSLLFITDIGFYPKAGFHFRKRSKEESNQFILIYCLDGEGWFKIEHQTYKVYANQVFVLPKGKSHSYGSDAKNPWTIYWIHFDGCKAPFFSEGLDKPFLISPEKGSRMEERFKLFEEIYAALKNGYSRVNLEYSITALFFYFGSIKYLSTYRNSAASEPLPIERDVADEAIHFMRENVRRRLSLKEIAAYVGLSSSHFSSIFHKKTGYSPFSYYIHLKVQEACHYLDFSDMKINQISMVVGFDDPFYFSRLFTKTMGISPSEYREKKKG